MPKRLPKYKKRGKKSDKLNQLLMQAPNQEAVNKVRYIFGERQI